VNDQQRGSWAVLIVTAFVVGAALAIRLVGATWPDFLLGFFVALPCGALGGWLTDRALKWGVDRYLDHLRGK
jgi:hypothetical protein